MRSSGPRIVCIGCLVFSLRFSCLVSTGIFSIFLALANVRLDEIVVISDEIRNDVFHDWLIFLNVILF